MIETIKEFFTASPIIAWSIVSFLLAVSIIVLLWDHVKWWWLNTWMSFPVIGRIARLSKDLNRDATDETWFKSEKKLCRDYKKFIRIQDEDDFNEKIDYITKAGDNGRTPMPTWVWVLTALMVFVEAMGFSYVLAGYTIPGASESLQQTGALGIAFLVSVLLVAGTHFAGHEIYVSSKIKHARREWVEDGRKQKFMTGEIALARSQSSDDNQPGYTQLANRVGTQGNYLITTVTAVFVVLVALGATYVRGQVLEKSLHYEVTGDQRESSFSSSADGLDMSAKDADSFNLPEADLAQNQAAKDKAKLDEGNIDRHGGWGTFIVLAVIFVFLQLLGVLFGYRWGFAGKNSRAAFRDIGRGRYSTYADVREHFTEIADTAQAQLESLQQKLMERNAKIGTEGMHTKNTFWKFLEISREEQSRDRDNQRTHTDKKATDRKAEVTKQTKHEAYATPIALDEVIRQLDALQDKDAKKIYINNLSQSLQAEIYDYLKSRKEAEKTNAEHAQFNAKLDDVL